MLDVPCVVTVLIRASPNIFLMREIEAEERLLDLIHLVSWRKVLREVIDVNLVLASLVNTWNSNQVANLGIVELMEYPV